MDFYATHSDLQQFVRALEAERRFSYLRCKPSATLMEPRFEVYETLHYLDSLGLASSESPAEQENFLLVEPDAEITVKEAGSIQIGPNEEKQVYRLDYPEEAVLVWFIPGGLYTDQYIRMGRIETPQTSAASVAFYRRAVQILKTTFAEIGDAFYGPEALKSGEAGVRYAWTWEQTVAVGKLWRYEETKKLFTFQDVEEARRIDLQLAAIPRTSRLSLDMSWEWLKLGGFDPPFDAQGKPLLPSLPPLSKTEEDEEDEAGGLSYYKTGVSDGDLDHLTIPRTFFGRSEIALFSFRNTDLSESTLCWNDWLDCDFIEADLSRADMRASRYVRCYFTGAALSGADLRRSSFEGCDFMDAKMNGTRLTREQASAMRQDGAYLNQTQQAEIEWMEDDGPEPPGG